MDGFVVRVMDRVKKAGIEKLDMVTDLMIGPERTMEATSPLPNE